MAEKPLDELASRRKRREERDAGAVWAGESISPYPASQTSAKVLARLADERSAAALSRSKKHHRTAPVVSEGDMRRLLEDPLFAKTFITAAAVGDKMYGGTAAAPEGNPRGKNPPSVGYRVAEPLHHPPSRQLTGRRTSGAVVGLFRVRCGEPDPGKRGRAADRDAFRAMELVLRRDLRCHDVVERWGEATTVCLVTGSSLTDAKQRFASIQGTLMKTHPRYAVTTAAAQLQPEQSLGDAIGRAEADLG